VSIVGLPALAPGSQLTLECKRKDGSTYSIPVNHTFNDNQARARMAVACGVVVCTRVWLCRQGGDGDGHGWR
jgi:hypothetical protein